MSLVLNVLGILVVVATALPMIRKDDWWIRVFDFPRAQILVAGIILLLLMVVRGGPTGAVEGVSTLLVTVAVLYQALRMLPYTVLWPKQVMRAESGDMQGDDSVSFLIANVLMSNRRFDTFRALVEEYRPDILLAVETDEWWADQLSMLGDDYPHCVELPLDNTYGMVLRSALPMEETEVRYLIEDDVPSLRSKLRLPSGREIIMYGVHPRPPAPQESTSTTPRDAELLLVGREVRELEGPIIVMGDLNDVAWSYTTRLFQRISGLLDPRRGRGMFNSYHADIPLMRWPLDHIFHSRHFSLISIQRLPRWGSDHFPVFARLRLHPEAAAQQEEVEATEEDRRMAMMKINRAL